MDVSVVEVVEEDAPPEEVVAEVGSVVVVEVDGALAPPVVLGEVEGAVFEEDILVVTPWYVLVLESCRSAGIVDLMDDELVTGEWKAANLCVTYRVGSKSRS